MTLKRCAICLYGLGLAILASAAENVPPDPKGTCTEEQAWQTGWPSVHGPFSNFLALRTGTRITNDLTQARVAWVSDERDFGSAKTGSQTFRTAESIRERLGPDAPFHPGNWAGVIIAEGKVFASSFRPAGEFCEAEFKSKEGAAEKIKFRLDAEDLVIALDAQTGKTLWKSAEPGGLVLSGGKRGGFQVAPVYWNGLVFSMGSTGRLFAYKAATGEKLWQNDIGPAHQKAAAEREKILAAAKAGQWIDPDGPGWHTSLVVADGVLVVPAFTGSNYGRDTCLRGLEAATGRLKWEVKDAVSRWATPNVWRHDDREYLLCATVSGELRLIDPREGKELWKVTGLGANYFTLAPSNTHVLVNVAASPDPKAKRSPGYYGAYRVSPNGAEKVWAMPEEPRNQIPTWFDSCALQRCLIRDGFVYLSTEGTKEEPGRFLLLKEETGEVLAERVNKGGETDCVGGLYYLVEDRLLVRVNSNHGPTHGGRHPFLQWKAAPGRIERMDREGHLCGMDLTEFATAYEVYMETPIVAGRMFERTVDGRLVCVDLRKREGLSTWVLELQGGYVGMPAPLPVRLEAQADGTVPGGQAYPPAEREAGLMFGQARRFAQWERVENLDAKIAGNRLSGAVRVNFGTHIVPVQLELMQAGGSISGTWKRSLPALAEPVKATGTVTGRSGSKQRIYPTPWLKETPLTVYGENPEGTTTWVLQMPDAITLGRKPAGLTVTFDYDGTRIVRAGATAYAFNQAWHEVDAGGLTVKDGVITGSVNVILNGDWWVVPNAAAGCSVAGRVELEVKPAGEELTGTYRAEFGVAWSAEGKVTGKVQPVSD